MDRRTINRSNEPQIDITTHIRTQGFWERGQQTFFNIRVTQTPVDI